MPIVVVESWAFNSASPQYFGLFTGLLCDGAIMQLTAYCPDPSGLLRADLVYLQDPIIAATLVGLTQEPNGPSLIYRREYDVNKETVDLDMKNALLDFHTGKTLELPPLPLPHGARKINLKKR